MSKQLLCCVLLMILGSNVLAQQNWTRYSWGTPNREGFTVLLPTIPEQIVKQNGAQGISAFVDFVRFEATFRDGVSKEEFDRQVKAAMNIVGGGPGAGSTQATIEEETNKNRMTKDITVCGYAGIEFGNSESVQQFFLVNSRLYHVWVSGANNSNPSVQKFFKSFGLIKPWTVWKGMRTNENTFERGTIIEPDLCRNIETTSIKDDPIRLPRNSALRLISKPIAAYPEEAKKKAIQGTVSLSVMFLHDGTIGDVSILKGVSKELDESAIRAAKQIKFEPQRRNGKSVDIRKTVEYSFAIY